MSSACSPGNQAVAKVNKVQRSTSFGVPNANSIKQMLLDWCRAKTRCYEVTPLWLTSGTARCTNGPRGDANDSSHSAGSCIRPEARCIIRPFALSSALFSEYFAVVHEGFDSELRYSNII